MVMVNSEIKMKIKCVMYWIREYKYINIRMILYCVNRNASDL